MVARNDVSSIDWESGLNRWEQWDGWIPTRDVVVRAAEVATARTVSSFLLNETTELVVVVQELLEHRSFRRLCHSRRPPFQAGSLLAL